MPLFHAAMASIGGLLFGYNTGIIGGVLPQIDALWDLSPFQEELAVSAILAGAVLGAAICGKLADFIGRRDCVMSTAALFVLGSFTAAMTEGPAAFIACRAMVGVALGAVSLAVPLHIAEMAPADARGKLLALNQLGITTGIMLSYAVAYLFRGDPEGWRQMLLAGAAPGVLLSFASLALTESPRWLMLQGDEDEARQTLSRLGEPDPQAVLDDVRAELAATPPDGWQALISPPVRLALLFGTGLCFFQQFTGINAILYNAPAILAYHGLRSEGGVAGVSLMLTAVNLLMTLGAILLVDRVSRRSLLQAGLCGMALCLAALALISGIAPPGGAGGPGMAAPGEVHSLPAAGVAGPWPAVVCLTLYVAFFSVSWGPLIWIILAEIYPLRIRGAAMSVPVAAHWLFAIVNASGAVFFLREQGGAGFYLLFTLVALAGFPFLRRFFPETAGLTLEAVQRRFAQWAAARAPGNAVYYAVTTVASTGGLLIGYNIGIIAGAQVLLTSLWDLTALEQGALVSSVSAGLFAGQIIAGKASDLFGRRYLLMSTAALYVAGAFACAQAQSLAVLAAARFLAGAAMGVTAVANAMYISEISPPRIRGRLLTLDQVTLNLGIVLSYLAAVLLEGRDGGWRTMFALAALPAVAFGVGLLFLPESPRWLFSRGRLSACVRVLGRLGVPDPARALDGLRGEEDPREQGGFAELFKGWLALPLLLGTLLMFLSVFTGFDALVFYAPAIFQGAGFTSNTASFMATFGLGLVNMVMTAVSMGVVDRLGRKTLLWRGLLAMAASLALAGLMLARPEWSGGLSRWLLLGSLCVFVAAFAVSLGPVAGVVVSEIYPQRVRGVALSLVYGLNSFFTFVFALGFPACLEALGSAPTFAVFAGLSVAGALICSRFLPETRGRTLEEIETLWRKGGTP
jgi:sugar porter (SP) family MFS transporter